MSNRNDRMAPDSSPNRPDQYGGRRVNNLPLIILGACLIGFMGIVVIVGMDRTKIRDQGKEETTKTESSTKMAHQLIGDMEAGYIAPIGPPVVEAKEEMPAEVPETVIEEPQPLDTYVELQPKEPKVDPWEAERRMVRQHNFKMFTAAITSPTAVNFASSGSRSPYGSSGYSNTVGSGAGTKREQLLAKIAEAKRQADLAANTDPTMAYKTRLAALKASGLISGENFGQGGDSNYGGGLLAGNTGGNDLFNSSSDGDWTLRNNIEAPATPFTLRAGFVIAGTMITGINSELPGKITGQISQNVYDTATGTQLLLPQGTKLTGQYVNDVAYGQSRILIAWNRLIFPDGKTLDIGSMPGVDSAGYSGFHDQVDNHYFRIFGSAFLLSGVTAVMSYTLDDEETDIDRPFSDTLSESLASNLGEVTLAMIRKNLNIAPTLKIRPGYRFNIMVVKDMVFKKPFQQFDY